MISVFQCPEVSKGAVFNLVSRKRGVIVEEVYHEGTPMCTLKAHMPVNESFGKFFWITSLHVYCHLMLLLRYHKLYLSRRDFGYHG